MLTAKMLTGIILDTPGTHFTRLSHHSDLRANITSSEKPSLENRPSCFLFQIYYTVLYYCFHSAYHSMKLTNLCIHLSVFPLQTVSPNQAGTTSFTAEYLALNITCYLVFSKDSANISHYFHYSYAQGLVNNDSCHEIRLRRSLSSRSSESAIYEPKCHELRQKIKFIFSLASD